MTTTTSPSYFAPNALDPASGEIDPLLMYEAKVTGHELLPFVPSGARDREIHQRKDAVILKTWRGVPVVKPEDSARHMREGLATIKELECQQAEHGERLFVFVFGVMTLVLAGIFFYFIKSMYF